MDTSCDWEHKTLISELSQGLELAKQLRVHLSSTSSSETRELLLQRILSSYDKALLILNWSGSAGQSQPVSPPAGVLESSISIEGSPRSADLDRGFNDQHNNNNGVSKKRKLLPTWTDQVRICSENGLEGPNDDGYSWRKYGQKDILGATYPRSYYRCTYRHGQNCLATKQVQRLDEDPTIFEITYRGKHTCTQGSISVAPPASPEKQEPKHNHNNHNHNHQQQQSNDTLLSFRANLKVNTENLDYKEMASPFSFPCASFNCMTSENQGYPFSTLVNDDLLGGFSAPFISPATSGSNYYSISPCQMNSFGQGHTFQHSESDLTEIISASANNSATNSPMGNLDFSIDAVDLDQNFPFNTPGFFN